MNAGHMNKWNLDSKTYVVTGGTKGIGYATVKSLLAHGAAGVLICSRTQDDCDKAVASILSEFSSVATTSTAPTTRVHAVVCDVSTVEGRNKLITAVREKFGDRLDGLVNNVGTNIRKDMSNQTAQEYETMMRTNIDSVYFLCKGLKDFLSNASGGASIVNVASAAGVQSSGTGAVYGMSKAAVIQFSKVLACEWAKDNIRVNAVAPWMTMTPMLEEATKEGDFDKVRAWTPLGRLAKVEEIAGPITFLLMPISAYVTGQCLGIDGGLTAQGFEGPCVTSSS